LYAASASVYSPAEPVQLAEPVVCVAECGTRDVGEPIAGAFGFVVGLRPGAVQGEDLRAVHQTVAAVGDQVGLMVAPARQRGRPFLRAAHVEDLLA
jgi:hypothetical protein